MGKIFRNTDACVEPVLNFDEIEIIIKINLSIFIRKKYLQANIHLSFQK